MAMPFCAVVLATCIRTNQTPNSVRRRAAPPHTILGLCPNKNGESYIRKPVAKCDQSKIGGVMVTGDRGKGKSTTIRIIAK
jgi:Tfp pilus assembly pilus retraction ATPase PilT